MSEEERLEWEKEDLREAVVLNDREIGEVIAIGVMLCIGEYCRLEDE